jgi:hypothetical protein
MRGPDPFCGGWATGLGLHAQQDTFDIPPKDHRNAWHGVAIALPLVAGGIAYYKNDKVGIAQCWWNRR